MDTIGGCPLTFGRQTTEASSEDYLEQKWTKDTETQKHPFYTYHGIILHLRKIPRQSQEIEPQHSDIATGLNV